MNSVTCEGAVLLCTLDPAHCPPDVDNRVGTPTPGRPLKHCSAPHRPHLAVQGFVSFLRDIL